MIYSITEIEAEPDRMVRLSELRETITSFVDQGNYQQDRYKELERLYLKQADVIKRKDEEITVLLTQKSEIPVSELKQKYDELVKSNTEKGINNAKLIEELSIIKSEKANQQSQILQLMSDVEALKKERNELSENLKKASMVKAIDIPKHKVLPMHLIENMPRIIDGFNLGKYDMILELREDRAYLVGFQ